MSRRPALALLAGLAAIGCGGPKASAPTTPEERMPAAPSIVASECRAAAATFTGTLRCPAKLPSSRDPVRFEFGGRSRTSQCGWQMGLQLRGPAFHLLFGGTCRALPLETAGGRWPAEADGLDARLGLVGSGSVRTGTPATTAGPPIRPVVVREDVTVRGEPAVLVAYGPYPASGTIHAGHQALVWNAGGEGAWVSGHFDVDVPAALRLRLLRATAESMRPVR